MGSVTQTGGALFGVLTGAVGADADGSQQIDLQSLAGQTCEAAVSAIASALAPINGDTEKIRVSINRALAEALDGVEVFDPAHITDEVIVGTMIFYLSESIFLQIVSDAGKAWNKAESATQAARAETDLRELIRVVVDKCMAPEFATGVQTISQQQMVEIERQAVIETWKEWEAYR